MTQNQENVGKVGYHPHAKIYSTSFVNSDSQSVHLTYRKPTCEIPNSLCHDPRQAPYTSNIPRTLSHPRIRNEESSGI